MYTKEKIQIIKKNRKSIYIVHIYIYIYIIFKHIYLKRHLKCSVQESILTDALTINDKSEKMK